ncbi:MAG: ribonuclease [Pseudomonadota bacterium]
MRLLVAGVDEAGRGPLAGPVHAAAVILDPDHPVPGLRDSKQLGEPAREALAALVQERALAWCVGVAEVEEIDRLNILQATLLAMQRAVRGLGLRPGLVQVDGNRLPALEGLCGRAETIVKGDAKVAAISAASILAKVSRDRHMTELDRLHPGYQLAVHKGYPTSAHLAALARLGPSPVHRRSFAPVRAVLEAAVPAR